MKTTLAKQGNVKQWYIIDAAGQTLGRMSVKIANLLRGRHKPLYTPHIDAGDYVIVINAEKVRLTGKKNENKQYMFYTGWVGNEYYRSAAYFRKEKPTFLIEHAVKGMMPRNKLGRQMMSKLKIFAGTTHPHTAQEPISYEV